MLTILRLNSPMYVRATALSLLALAAATQLDARSPLRALVLTTAAMAIFWSLASLAASWWIYDRSHIYDLRWLRSLIPNDPRTWLNLHNGLDEIHAPLRQLFPAAHGQTLDIFDEREMHEPSIVKARRSITNRATVNWRQLPHRNQSRDLIVIMFTAHELRRAESRERLFLELQRVLDDHGRLLLVEHMRDWRNLLAFGPGFFHFFSKRTWLRATKPAGLALEADLSITPFVRAMVYRKECTFK